MEKAKEKYKEKEKQKIIINDLFAIIEKNVDDKEKERRKNAFFKTLEGYLFFWMCYFVKIMSRVFYMIDYSFYNEKLSIFLGEDKKYIEEFPFLSNNISSINIFGKYLKKAAFMLGEILVATKYESRFGYFIHSKQNVEKNVEILLDGLYKVDEYIIKEVLLPFFTKNFYEKTKEKLCKVDDNDEKELLMLPSCKDKYNELKEREEKKMNIIISNIVRKQNFVLNTIRKAKIISLHVEYSGRTQENISPFENNLSKIWTQVRFGVESFCPLQIGICCFSGDKAMAFNIWVTPLEKYLMHRDTIKELVNKRFNLEFWVQNAIPLDNPHLQELISGMFREFHLRKQMRDDHFLLGYDMFFDLLHLLHSCYLPKVKPPQIAINFDQEMILLRKFYPLTLVDVKIMGHKFNIPFTSIETLKKEVSSRHPLYFECLREVKKKLKIEVNDIYGRTIIPNQSAFHALVNGLIFFGLKEEKINNYQNIILITPRLSFDLESQTKIDSQLMNLWYFLSRKRSSLFGWVGVL
jgi:hypothetical protein